MPGRASPSSRQAIAAANGVGLRVTARQLERWRQDHVIPAPARRALGRGRGSTSCYDDDALAWIVDAARFTDLHLTMDELALALFARGWPIPEIRLRSAYRALIAAATV